MERRNSFGCLPATAIGTLVLFYLTWAAMHDIARESDTTLEYLVLLLIPPAFALLYHLALRHLTRRGKLAWLASTALLMLLFTAAAIQSALHPKYPADPTLAAMFLTAAVPALSLIAYHLIKLTSRTS
ncbi:MAG: hypothetical protein HY820_10735 [Acidobacteria bacterium]|nr:hypothetical protein [Acidobacteriota bacterium]